MNKNPKQNKSNRKQDKTKSRAITSLILPGKELYEQLYDSDKGVAKLACWKDNCLQTQASFQIDDKEKIIPYHPGNPLLKHNIILFPSSTEEYNTEEELIKEIRSFIYRYVDVTEAFELVSTYYVLLSWIYDTFEVLPYLRICGDYGHGKTRFLQTVGSICYKPTFASGASTVAPIFHILDQIGGTLILDEGDFRFSNEQADIAKILNSGNAKGFPVLRCEKVKQGEFVPKAFKVFGPKIITSRNNYEDIALESRFITEEVGWRKIRDDIPLTLPGSFTAEALKLRNKLLLWRFHNFHKTRNPEKFTDPRLDNRINQIFSPLLCLIANDDDREKVITLALSKNEQIRSDRGMHVEADILLVIKEVFLKSEDLLSISKITQIFSRKFAALYENKITPKWIGSIVRQKLRLSTRKSNGIYVISENQKEKLKRLYEKFDINS